MAVKVSLGTIAEHIGAVLHGSPDIVISGIATLQKADSQQLSFLANRRYQRYLAMTGAGAVILAEDDRESCPTATLVLDNPYLGYARAAALFNPWENVEQPGIHPTAVVAEDVYVAPDVYIGPQTVVESGAELADNVYIGAACVIRQGVKIGAGSRLDAHVVLCPGVILGKRVIIHPGAVLGSDGFGLANDRGHWVKIPQLGGVLVGDDVEIGANTTIDRGALEDTVIKSGVKLDNQIQIAHNVIIGEHTAIAGCVGIAGSTCIGRHCSIGGGVGIAGHLEIADNTHITGGSVVLQSIRKSGVYSSGTALQENQVWHKNYLRFKQLNQLAERVKKLEK